MRQYAKLLLITVVLACLMAFTASAADYTYTVRFYSGSQGTFSGQEWVTFENLNYGDRVTFNRNAVQLSDAGKYYIRGIRESGKDNNTVGLTSFVVTKDQDYVVAYGILGNAVQYTVRYVDRYGNQLAPDDTYYGNVGDKPVVAYLYIDGYQPQYYNITGTLRENAADNVFTFVYVPVRTGAGVTIVAPDGGVTVIDNTGTGNNGNTGNTGNTGNNDNNGGNTTPSTNPGTNPGTVVTPGNNDNSNENGPEEILDTDVPLANPDDPNGEPIDDDLTPLERFLKWITEDPVHAGTSAAALIAILIWLWWMLLLLKRKKKDEENDEQNKQ